MSQDFYPLNIQDPMVFTSLEDGKIKLIVSITNEVDTGVELADALTAWVDDTDPVEITQTFKISSIVDYLNHSHQYGNGLIDPDAKPIFSALRAEMLAEIARIDALVYSPEIESSEGEKP